MFKATYRVYYEDTDAGGVVYYANYLKFAERARTDWLRGMAIEQTALKSTYGILFVVRDVQMRLKKPARLDDLLSVSVCIGQTRRASLRFTQEITCKEAILAQLEVHVACVNESFKPVALPEWIVAT